MIGGEMRVRAGALARLAGAAALVIAAAVLLIAIPGSAQAAKPSADNRYSLVKGCFALRSELTGRMLVKAGGGYAATAAGANGAEAFRMQATDLGRYLFYGTARDFLALAGDGIEPAAAPSNDSDWTVREDGAAFTVQNDFAGRQLAVGDGGVVIAVPAGSAGDAGRFSFVEADGCPRYPEVELNVRGRPWTGSPAYGETTGLWEAHMHGMAFEFLGGEAHCGQPWHRFGAPYALVDCEDHYPNGCAAVLENVLFGNPARCHDPVGWPTFKDWPHHRSLTHEQSYYRWLERAWMGGMRLYTNLMVENRVLCEVYPYKRNGCNEMDSVLLQIKRIHEMQDYIDAQAGGPGKGFFRIVTNPFQARKVINRGKLAVVLGLEVSEPFDCRLRFDNPTCDSAQIDAWLERLERLGLRQFELVNKFDNALTGVAGDAGTTGTFTNTGNFYATGRFWDLETCEDPDNADRSPLAIEDHNEDQIIANGFDALLPPGAAPVYGPPPHCNARGLSPLGEHAIRELMRRGMIFDPDHMSVRARNAALNLVESRDYSGIISSHSWSTPNAFPRILRLGGVIAPSTDEADHFIEKWQEVRDDRAGRQYFGLGYGADQNGFASQPGPREGGSVSYPFRSFHGNLRLDRQRSGERVFDINSDGVAHYGLYPDWLEDIRAAGGKRTVRDLARGAEAYLQMWERAEGIEGVRCDQWRQRFLTPRGLPRRVALGSRPKRVLRRAGQPVSRTRAWRWCANTRSTGGASKQGPKQKVVAVFSKRGRVALVQSTLRKHRAAGIRPGMPASVLRGSSRRLGGALWVRDAGRRSRFVYGVRGGRVDFVAVGTASATASATKLRRHLSLARSG